MSAFNVKWADFSMNVVNSFKQLRNSDYFIDVTLASDDEKIVSANKVVLAAGSKYFETILKNNPLPQQIICLQGINNEELNQILDYLYYGEVEIDWNKISRFIDISKRFKLHGLWNEQKINISQIPETKSNDIDISSRVNIESAVHSKSNPFDKPFNEVNDNLGDDICESTNSPKTPPEKSENLKISDETGGIQDYHKHLNDDEASINDADDNNRESSVSSRNTVNNEELRFELQEIQFTRKDDNEPNIYSCKNCELKFDKFYKAKWHYERTHQNLTSEIAILKDLALYIKSMKGFNTQDQDDIVLADLKNKMSVLNNIHEKKLNPNLKKKYSEIKQWLEMRINYSVNL